MHERTFVAYGLIVLTALVLAGLAVWSRYRSRHRLLARRLREEHAAQAREWAARRAEADVPPPGA